MQKPVVFPKPKGPTPVLGAVPPSKKPVVNGADAPKKWTFSFRYWRQIDKFGLDKSEPKWFVSFLDKLQELSKYNIDEFRSNPSLTSNWRYHPIDWGKKNVPIERSTCTWVDSDYLNNEEEFPFVQFQISMALGRVVGFWDDLGVFNIVLLDPLHNIQPSKDYAYTVNPCSPLSCNYSDLLSEIDEVKRHQCSQEDCKVHVKIQNIGVNKRHKSLILIEMDQDTEERVRSILASGLVQSNFDIFDYGAKKIEADFTE